MTIPKVSEFPHRLNKEDFARHFGVSPSQLTPRCLDLIAKGNFSYRILEGEERDEVVLKVLKALRSDLKASGPERHGQWETGWTENLNEFIASNYDLTKLIPKFVRNRAVIRLDGNYIMPEVEDFETAYVKVLRAWLYTYYFKDISAFFEFGVGSGHNLVEAADYMPGRKLVGLDWAEASSRILAAVRERYGYNLEGHRFDLFHPDPAIKVDPGAGVLTIGTLEQLGTNFDPFLDFLLQQNPKICVHVETLYEVYNQDSLFDWLAAAYLEKRNYLRGYLTRLQELERAGRIRILAVRRTFGSFYHDGYTYVAWEPVA